MRAAVLIVVLGLLAFASGLKVYNQNENFSLSCCGSKSFDTTEAFCCIDKVYKLSDSDSNQCCGNNRLSNDRQCCSAVEGEVSLNDKQISTDLTCCGTIGYNPSTELCCAPNSIVQNRNGNLQCCGPNRGFDPSNDLCCETVNVKSKGSCSGDTSVNVNYNVISNAASQGKQCCANNAFDPSTQLCCGGSDDARVISNKDGNLQCCGNGSYDNSRQTCCQSEETVEIPLPNGESFTYTKVEGRVSNGASLTCCEDSLNAFDSATQICCGGNVQRQNSDNSLSCCGSKTYNTQTQTCCESQKSSYKKEKGCCGACDSYVAVVSTEYTVGNVANGQCCGGKAYDDTRNICCGNNIIRQNNDNALQCCGSDAYDPSKDICCSDDTLTHNKVFKNKADDDVNYECCLNVDASDCNVKYNFDIYDSAKKSCPCGKVVDIDDDLFLTNTNPDVQPGCCGTTQVDANSVTCCAKAIHDVDPAIGLQCCDDDGKTLYNPGYQVCCGGSSSKCSVPCGAKKTRDVEEVEEVEEVEAKKDDKKDKKKDDKKDKKKKKNNSSKKNKVQCGDHCCEGEGYFQAYQKCCEGKILDFNSAAEGSSPMACCGDELYNTNFRQCCTETTVKKVTSCGIEVSQKTAVIDADFEICCGSGVISVA